MRVGTPTLLTVLLIIAGNDDVVFDVSEDDVAFLLVIIEEEPHGAVLVVGCGYVAAVAVTFGVVEQFVVFSYGVGGEVEAVLIGEEFVEDALGEGLGHGVDIFVDGHVAGRGHRAVANDDGGIMDEGVGVLEVIEDVLDL